MPYHEQPTFDELTLADLSNDMPQDYPLEYLWGFLMVYGDTQAGTQSPEPPAYSVDEIYWFMRIQYYSTSEDERDIQHV